MIIEFIKTLHVVEQLALITVAVYTLVAGIRETLMRLGSIVTGRECIQNTLGKMLYFTWVVGVTYFILKFNGVL